MNKIIAELETDNLLCDDMWALLENFADIMLVKMLNLHIYTDGVTMTIGVTTDE